MYAGKIGNHATGIDYNPHNCERARERARILQLKNTEFRQGDLRALDQLADQLEPFDQIICFETIEHIINDRKLIADLAALLKPGGRLLLSAPYKGYKPLLGDKLSDREDGGHVRWGYTHEELRQMLSECGLQVTTAEYVSGFVSQQLGNLLRLMGKVSPTGAWAATFPLRVLQASDRFITKLLNYPYLSVAVVGVKNGSSTAGR
jgi:2-polyprenyl-3-methyl-5-hydroxy-6-metoxy-1,4-benzoquinol methylase